MAITLVSSPSNWTRVYDTNRCTYVFSSDKYREPNYNFLIELYEFDATISGTTGASTLIGTFKLYPLNDGTCEFNPTTIYKNLITYDINLSNTSFSECNNSAKEFQMVVYDYYSSGTTSGVTSAPTKQGTPWTEPGRGTIFYNGCQQEVPYDYIPLNFLQGNNLQWVMSGASSGKFLTDATNYNLDNEDEAFLWILANKSDIPTRIGYRICYWDSSTGATILPDPITIDGYLGLLGSVQQQTSQSDSLPQTNNYTANYYITGTTSTQQCWRYRIERGAGVTDLTYTYIDCTGTTKMFTITSGYRDFTARKGTVVVLDGNYTLYDLGPVTTIPPPIVIVPGEKPHVTCVNVYDTNVSATYEDTKMWYFPISMRSLISSGLVTNNNIIDNWLYYTVDILSGTTKLNKNPFYVYKKCKEDKYAKWQLFWLNPHGGFDRFTFDRKVDIDYEIERTTYKQRYPVGTPTSFDSYFGGEQILNVKSVEEITLRTNLVTQMESQLLIQLFQSPKVFILKEYQYDETDPTNIYKYGVPCIVTSNEVKYEQKKNTKEIYYEIKIRSANQKILQNY